MTHGPAFWNDARVAWTATYYPPVRWTWRILAGGALAAATIFLLQGNALGYLFMSLFFALELVTDGADYVRRRRAARTGRG